jgi:uncharacterized protein
VPVAVLDTGPLYAVADLDDQDHAACLEVLRRRDLRLVIPAFVAAEAAFLVGDRLGPKAESAFVRGLQTWDVALPAAEEWDRIALLVEQYADFPLGAVDASVVALAEQLKTDLVVTLDRRHFRAVKPLHCEAFTILPD